MNKHSKTPPTARTREELRAESLSRAIDAIGQTNFLPGLLDYLRVDVPFVGILQHEFPISLCHKICAKGNFNNSTETKFF